MENEQVIALSRQSALYNAVASYPNPCKYTVEQRIYAATIFAGNGNIKRTGREIGIPANTIGQWKEESSWWHDLQMHIRDNKSDELDANISKIINKASAETMDRLENGNEVIDKNGEKRRVKMSGKDCIMVAAIAFDKRQLIRMAPTSIKATDTNLLTKLATQLVDIKRNQVAIDAQRIDDKPANSPQSITDQSQDVDS